MKVLLVEDNPVEAKLMEAAFSRRSPTEKKVELDKTADLKSTLERITSHGPFDLILLDLMLPDSAGLDTFQCIYERTPHTPIVVSTGTDDESLALEALRRGAQDYLVKGYTDLRMLLRVCHYAVERKKLDTELKLANEAMSRHERVLNETMESLKKSNEELKATRLQLIQAAKLEVVGRLAAGVAHEVKNPLAMMRMGVDYFLKEKRAADKTDAFMLETMADAIGRADMVIKDMLDFSSLQRLEIAPGNLNELVEKTLRFLNHELESRKVEVVLKLDRALPPVHMDRNRLEQVVVNLITNAMHAMRENPRLTVCTSAKPVDKTGFRVGYRKGDPFTVSETVALLEIHDNGSGIDPEATEKIYDPFFTTKLNEGGTGLGLSIVKSIIEMHRGFIRVANRPEGGGVTAALILKLAGEAG